MSIVVKMISKDVSELNIVQNTAMDKLKTVFSFMMKTSVHSRENSVKLDLMLYA